MRCCCCSLPLVDGWNPSYQSDNLTRANIMKEASNLNMTLPMLYPGVNVKTGADDFNPIQRMQMIQFNGTGYDLMGKVVGPE